MRCCRKQWTWAQDGSGHHSSTCLLGVRVLVLIPCLCLFLLPPTPDNCKAANFGFNGKNGGLPVSQNSMDLQWIHPERCFNSPLSRRQNQDHRPRKGGWPDEGSCLVFPGKRRIIRRLQISAPLCGVRRQWQSRRLKNKSSKRKELTGMAEKSQIEGSCRGFPGKRCIIKVKANFRLVLMNTAPVATKVKR